MNRRDFIAHLGTHGCKLHRQGGRHEIWINPANGKKSPVPRHRTTKKGIVRAVCAQLDIPLPGGI